MARVGMPEWWDAARGECLRVHRLPAKQVPCAECSQWASDRMRPPDEVTAAALAAEAAAMWGLAENEALPVKDRLACALKALDYYGREDR